MTSDSRFVAPTVVTPGSSADGDIWLWVWTELDETGKTWRFTCDHRSEAEAIAEPPENNLNWGTLTSKCLLCVPFNSAWLDPVETP